MKSKKAIFFSTDALIALAIILITILVVYPLVSTSQHRSELQEDVIEVFSTLKVNEINNVQVQSLIASGDIRDINNSILEQIGEFYITDKALAINFTEAMLDYLDTSENIGIWHEDSLIASKNSSPYETARNIETSSHVVSGLSNIQQNGSITGYSARAWLSSNLAQKYFYFGGYAGDGNISLVMNYSGELNLVELEIAVNKDFDVYINGNYSGHYENSSSEFAPSRYDLSAYNQSFYDGENTIRLVADNLYIAGGYFKVVYESFEGYHQPTRYYFPGVEGLINLYDGFYIPGQLNSLNIFLHMDSGYETFLTIGNTTVFNGTTSGEEFITINNSNLSSLLDYPSLSQKTIPLRLGLESATYKTYSLSEADAYSVTDLSESMKCSKGGFCFLFQYLCENICGGVWLEPLNKAKEANEAFIDIVLNSSENRVGLVAYEDDVQDSNCHSLSNDSVSLKNKVNSWTAEGFTCICCGINSAVNSLIINSSSDKFQSIVVMSDGEANVLCDEQGTGNAKQDAIQAACEAYNNHNITVYSIGFGDDSDNSTLQSIANCGNGTFYFANSTSLIEIYKQVAEEIMEASYKEQTIEATGNISTLFYPDSYIEFDYITQIFPYGMMTSMENQFYSEYYGSFNIPAGSEIIEAKAVSYSGPRWTDGVEINNLTIYNLSLYGEDYTKLGDPYPIQIPISTILQDNLVKVTTGTSPDNSTFGSQYNKILYTIKQNASSYSEIVALAEGCIWNLEFEDNSNSTLFVPEDYLSTDLCYYKSTGQNISNDEDAIQLATLSLLQLLDSDSDGRIDVKFTEQNLEISASEITGIPYIISSEIQARRWS